MSQELWEKQRPAREGTNGFLQPSANPKPEPEAAKAPAKKAAKKAK